MNHSYPDAPSTPTRKRSSSATQDEDNRIHGSQKRLKLIQEALKQQNTPSSSSQPSHFRQANEQESPTISFRPNLMSPLNDTTSTYQLPVTPKSSQEPLGHSQVPSSSNSMQGDDFVGHPRDPLDRTTPARQEETNELTADSIHNMIHRLIQVPDYIRKLERTKIAADKARDAKNSKIALLQAEVEDLKQEVKRLKAREKVLEEVVDAFERQQ